LRQVGSRKLELNEAVDAIAGVVAIGLPPSHGGSIGNALLTRVRSEFPRMRLHIVEDGPRDSHRVYAAACWTC
jgi:hypothetical protein